MNFYIQFRFAELEWAWPTCKCSAWFTESKQRSALSWLESNFIHSLENYSMLWSVVETTAGLDPKMYLPFLYRAPQIFKTNPRLWFYNLNMKFGWFDCSFLAVSNLRNIDKGKKKIRQLDSYNFFII